MVEHELQHLAVPTSSTSRAGCSTGLETRFGAGNVFMDVDSIEPGLDYGEVIDKAVGSCDVLLAVIGNGWLDHRRV